MSHLEILNFSTTSCFKRLFLSREEQISKLLPRILTFIDNDRISNQKIPVRILIHIGRGVEGLQRLIHLPVTGFQCDKIQNVD